MCKIVYVIKIDKLNLRSWALFKFTSPSDAPLINFKVSCEVK